MPKIYRLQDGKIVKRRWALSCAVLAAAAIGFPTGFPSSANGTEARKENRPEAVYGSMVDVDGNRYRTVIIGKQEWMVENLRTTRLSDGTPIPMVSDQAAWGTLNGPGYAWYDNSAPYGVQYGALYNWHAVGTGKLAPPGWRIPSQKEWTQLIEVTLGGTSLTGGKTVLRGELKSTRTEPLEHPRWNAPNEGANNTTGFDALPGGHRGYSGVFNYLGRFGFWWTSTQANPSSYAWYRGMRSDNGDVFMTSGNKKNGFSVRCVRDLK